MLQTLKYTKHIETMVLLFIYIITFIYNNFILVMVVVVWTDSQSCYVSSRWAWVLQDALGIAFCLYMLKTVRLPTFKVGRHTHKYKLIQCGEVFFFKVLIVFC